MKNFTFSFLIIILGVLVCNQCAKEKKMPITTTSETAKTLYYEAMTAYEDGYFAKGQKLAIDALKEDPELGKPLTVHLTGLWSLRIGDYRAIYQIDNNQLLIFVIKIGHRKKIYG